MNISFKSLVLNAFDRANIKPLVEKVVLVVRHVMDHQDLFMCNRKYLSAVQVLIELYNCKNALL